MYFFFLILFFIFFFFFNDTATTEIYTLSLHDALPIHLPAGGRHLIHHAAGRAHHEVLDLLAEDCELTRLEDDVEGGGHRGHHRDLEGGRGADPLALRDVGSHEHPRAFREVRPALA